MRTILTYILVAFLGTCAECANLAYTSVAVHRKAGWVYGYTEEECINDCDANNKCLLSSSSTEYDCIRKGTASPIAKTYRYKQTTRPECLSRCGKIRESYEWCYVDQDKNWDYCNGDTNVVWVRNQQWTKKLEPCKTDCKQDCGYFYCSYTCMTPWNSTETCDPTITYSYARAKTVNNLPCLGWCMSVSGSKTSKCYYGTEKKQVDYCALPQTSGEPDWWDQMETLSEQDYTSERVDGARKRRASPYHTIMLPYSWSQLNVRRWWAPSHGLLKIELQRPMR